MAIPTLNPSDVFGASERGLAARNVNLLRGQEQEDRRNALAAQQQAASQQQIINRLIAESTNPTTGEVDRARLSIGLANAGQGGAIFGAQENVDKRAASVADIGKTRAETGEIVQNTSDKERAAKHDQLTKLLNFVAGAETPEGYDTQYAIASQMMQPGQLESLGFTPTFEPGKVRAARLALQSEKDRLDLEEQLRRSDIDKGTLGVRRGELDVNRGQLGLNKAEFEFKRQQAALDREDARKASEEALAAARNTSGLTPEQKRDRDVKFPKAQLAYKSATQDIDSIIADLRTLSGHSGLAGISGGIEGRTPSFTASSTAAQALYDKILAKGQFRALQQMREASPTGGALGNVSDTEGAMLRASFGALNQAQSDESLEQAMEDVITDLTNARNNLTEAYDLDYPGKRAPQAAPAGARAGGGEGDVLAEADAILKRGQ
jgi:hypothetical protein